MSKSITIPADRGSRITVRINGVEYTYAAGATVTVPNEVAACIANMLANDPGGTRQSAKDELLAGVTADIGGLEDDLEALDTRVTALDDEGGGAIALLDARATALEGGGEEETTEGE